MGHPESYRSETFRGDIDDETLVEDLVEKVGLITYHLLPRDVREGGAHPTVHSLKEFKGDFADHRVSVNVVAPRNSNISPTRWHSSKGLRNCYEKWA